jgi:hypothetical protein
LGRRGRRRIPPVCGTRLKKLSPKSQPKYIVGRKSNMILVSQVIILSGWSRKQSLFLSPLSSRQSYAQTINNKDGSEGLLSQHVCNYCFVRLKSANKQTDYSLLNCQELHILDSQSSLVSFQMLSCPKNHVVIM